MAKIVWDKEGEHFFEHGVSKGVLFTKNESGKMQGVAWNGLSSVSESPEGAEATAIYADDIKYLELLSVEEFKCSIEAYTYPDEFMKCDGSYELMKGVTINQQKREKFALSYQTKIGNDVNSELGYKIHIVYGCLAQPSERSNETINDSPEAITMSWEISTTPVPVSGFKPMAHLVIDSTKIDPEKLALIEAKLYGSDSEEPTLLYPDEILELCK